MMKPTLRSLAGVAVPLIVLAAASGASAGILGSPTATARHAAAYATAYPAVVGGDGSSYVDVAVQWAPNLLRRAGTDDTMKITLTGYGRKGAPVRFDRKKLHHHGKGIEVVRLHVKKNQRGAFTNARNVVVSAAHHWDSPADANTMSNLVAVSNANVSGSTTRTQFSRKVIKDCDVATLGPNSVAKGCDFHGADLSNTDLSHANLSGANLNSAILTNTDLSSANVTSASMVGTTITGTNFGATSQAAFTMPGAADPTQGTTPVCQQTGGGPMCEAIYSAKSTVGAVYYQFAGPNVTRWLQDALVRGVDVFVIENSANTTAGSSTTNPLCQTVSATDPACAWSPSADPFYALEAQLKSVVKDDGSTGKVRVQFSSPNFNITHQKSILIDVLDTTGKALDATAIQTQGGFAIVSTGNLQAFPNAWGQRTMKNAAGTQVVANPEYLTNPSASCVPATDAGCAKEWTPRDFAMRVTDPAILARIAGVYASDLACAPANVTNVQSMSTSGLVPGLIADPQGSDPVSAQWPETWSNGSTYATNTNDPRPPGQAAGAYPAPGLYPNGYFAYGKPTYYVDSIAGNVRARQIALINAATKTLVVYNEELTDYKYPASGKPIDVTAPSIVNALVGAGQRGVKVTIVMANAFWTPPPPAGGTPGPPVPDTNSSSAATEFNVLTSATNFTQKGAVVPTIMLLDADGTLYIHGKAIIADGVDGWFGSINASAPSMNMNRELGLGVTIRNDGSTPYIPATYSPQMIAAVTSSGAIDAAAGTSWTSGQPKPKPASKTVSSSSYLSSAQFPCINMTSNATSGLPLRDPLSPAVPPQAPAG